MFEPDVAQSPRLHGGRPPATRIEHGVVLAASTRAGLRWLTALLDSSPRSVCLSEPTAAALSVRERALIRKLCIGGFLFPGERDDLVDAWRKAAFALRPAWFFAKEYQKGSKPARRLGWLWAGWSQRGLEAYRSWAYPRFDQSFDLVVPQVTQYRRLGEMAAGLNARLLILRRHPCAVVASQLHGLRRGYLPPPDRVAWYEQNQMACQQLELGLSQVLRMPLGDLLAYQWLVQNRHYQEALTRFPSISVAMQLEDFCRNPEAMARKLFAFLGWPMTPQTLRFLDRSTRARQLWPRQFPSGWRGYTSVYRNSAAVVEGWREELTGYEQSRLLDIAASLPELASLWSE